MSNDDTSAADRGSGLSDQLGPLPETALTHDRHGHMLLIGPCYTAEQMRAYAAQEVAAARQRISALMEAHTGIRLSTLEYLEMMRQGPTPQEWAELDANARA